jgi:hypothetical protein
MWVSPQRVMRLIWRELLFEEAELLCHKVQIAFQQVCVN